MITSLPPHIYSQNTPAAGTTLYTSKSIPPGELIFRVERPLVAAIDSGQLGCTCEGCYLSLADGATVVRKNEVKKKIKTCAGCKVVGYCSQACQAQSWKSHHKYECKIFKNLHPKVLPNTVRLVIQLLLRRRAGCLSDEEWNSFLALQSHIEDFQSQHTKNSDNLTTWQTIQLMSQAASSYSGSQEPLQFIQTMTARVLINAHTLTTPTLDPLGVYISIPSSLLNHSCVPNAALTFSLHGVLSVRSLHEIQAFTALTICYTDSTIPADLRLADLLERYHFTCICASCTVPYSSSSCDTMEAMKSECYSLVNKAILDPTQKKLPVLVRALMILSPKTRPHQHPLPQIHQQLLLAGLFLGELHLALTHALVLYFYVDPVLYAPAFHPVRVVHGWVLLRLLSTLLIEGEMEKKATGRAGTMSAPYGHLDPCVVIGGLWQEVNEGVQRSHGSDSSFTAEVREWGLHNGPATIAPNITVQDREREWAKLRKLADESQRDPMAGC